MACVLSDSDLFKDHKMIYWGHTKLMKFKSNL